MTSIAKQRISKHTSLTIETVFSVGYMQSGYKKVFGRTGVVAVEKGRVGFRLASLPGYELGIGSYRIMARKELGCEKKTSCVI
jgi:hypothetical protein